MRRLLPIGICLALLTGCGSAGSSPQAGAAPSGGAGVLPPRPSQRQKRTAARQNRAIDRLLVRSSYIARGGRRREIALTFDDGPGADTQRLLGILRRLHVQATFFQLSSAVARFPQLARRELRWRFAIGDHTQTHPFLKALSAGAQAREIVGAAARIHAYGAPYPRLFRPPFGAFDARTLKIARRAHMLLVLWSVDTRDFSRPGSAQIVHSAISGAKPGAIILMHDGGGPRGQTLAAVPAIVRALRRKHYKLVSVPELILHNPPRGRQPRPRDLSGR